MPDDARTLELILKARNLASAEVDKLGTSLRKAGDDADKGHKGLLDFGKGAALLAGGGVLALGAALVGAGKAAADEQINIAKMATALKAAVPAFDGNTAAIERTIAKREELGFSDDDLRASMATLVTSTHDVKAATDLQSLAMDLARLKGVDLATASEALAKANAGSTKELKALGITVDDASDKTQVFAAIQKAAAGQSEAYAKTSAGKWETLQIKIADLVEDVGGALLPVFDTLVTFATDTLIPTIGSITSKVGEVVAFLWGNGTGPLAIAINAAKGLFGGFVTVLQGILSTIGTIITKAQEAIAWLTNLAGQQSGPGSAYGHALRPQFRAAGGPVDAGSPYIVGERGPELFVPGTGGSIVPNAGGAPVEIPVIVDGRELARIVDAHLFYSMAGAPAIR